MSRFFKSAAFPIIVVVVLAFFAQRMIIDNSGSSQAHTWNDFMTAASQGKVEYLKTNEGDNSLKYSTTAADGSQAVTIGVPSPDSLEVCALLVKPERQKVELPTRYVGFEIPNRFAIGYGLDYGERYRNLPYVASLKQ